MGQGGLAAVTNGTECLWLNIMKFVFHLHDMSYNISQHSWSGAPWQQKLPLCFYVFTSFFSALLH